MKAIYRYMDWLSDQYRVDPRFLAILRVAYALWVLLLPTDYLWVRGVPEAFFQPRMGPIRLFSEIPPDGVLVGLQVAAAVLAALLAVGFRTRLVSVLLAVLMILGSGIVYSFGKVDHFILFELLPIAMAVAGWGARFSVDSWLRRRVGRTMPSSSGFPVLLWGMVVGFALFSAALPKAMTGWLDPARHATRGYLAREVADPKRVGAVGSWVFQFDSDILWKAVDYGTLLAEGGLIFALLYPLLYRLWLVMILAFHVSVYLTMGISFAGYVFVYLPFFGMPIMIAVGWLRRRSSRPDHKSSGPSPVRNSVSSNAVSTYGAAPDTVPR